MKDMTFGTMIAVFEEIFGRGLFWAMVIVSAVVTLAYFYVLIRDRAVSWNKFLLAQLSMPFGAIAADRKRPGGPPGRFSFAGLKRRAPCPVAPPKGKGPTKKARGIPPSGPVFTAVYRLSR